MVPDQESGLCRRCSQVADSPVRPVKSVLELELVVVEVTRRYGPRGCLWRPIRKRRGELREAVPVDSRILVRDVIEHSDPIMFALFEGEERAGIGP